MANFIIHYPDFFQTGFPLVAGFVVLVIMGVILYIINTGKP